VGPIPGANWLQHLDWVISVLIYQTQLVPVELSMVLTHLGLVSPLELTKVLLLPL
jgi:hypothetical protein